MGQKKIKILRIINRFNIGGPTYNATFLTRFISDKFETLLVGGLPEEGEADSLHILEEYGVTPILITEMQRVPNVISDRKALIKIKEIIKEFNPDIVHTHAAKAGALGRKAAYDCKIPVIVHTFHGHVFHSYFNKYKTELYRLIEKRLAKRSTGIIAISDSQKYELSEVYRIAPKEKINVIQLGFDLNPFQENLVEKRKITRTEYNLDDDFIAIAIIGRLARIKNHNLFLKAIKLVQNETKQKLVFFIVGDGDQKKDIEDNVANLKSEIAIDIRMTSWVKDIKTFNAGMDIICLTSDNEGTPVSLIEAQACNIPVVSTDVGGVKDVVSENETGYISPKNDADNFAKNILLLSEDKNNRTRMSQNGWSYVKNRFHYTRLVSDVENFYFSLLEKHKK